MTVDEMSEASRWRLDLARSLAPAYTTNRAVAAIGVGGSVSRGCADRYSDAEIGVFWDRAPSDAERLEAATTAGAAGRRDFGHNGDQWAEEYRVRNIKIDVSHRLVETMQERLADVVDRYDTDIAKQGLASAVRHMVPLHGAELIAAWQMMAARYPADLADRVIRENLVLGPHNWLEMLADRGSLIELYEILCTVEKRLLCVLMGLNKVYNPGFKWIDRLAADLPLAPVDLADRLRGVLRNEPVQAVGEAHVLIEEVYALVDRNAPQIDTTVARTRLRQSR